MLRLDGAILSLNVDHEIRKRLIEESALRQKLNQFIKYCEAIHLPSFSSPAFLFLSILNKKARQ